MNFDKLANHYKSSNIWNDGYDRPAIIKLVGNVKGKTILDAGCSTGHLIKKYSEQGAKFIYGIDISSDMINIAKTEVSDHNNIALKQHDLNKGMNFIKENSIDIISSSLTLHYLKDWSGVLSEFKRILKPGGILVFSVHHPMMISDSFENTNYFENEVIHDEWNVESGKIQVDFYSKSFSQMFKYLKDNNFVMKDLVEPKPLAKFKQINKKAYDDLLMNPRFIYFKCTNN